MRRVTTLGGSGRWLGRGKEQGEGLFASDGLATCRA